MSAYNKVNGAWCGHHRHLLTEVLRHEWGFQGLVMSDFVLGVRERRRGRGGHGPRDAGSHPLSRPRARARQGTITAADVDGPCAARSARSSRFAWRGEPERYRREAVASPAHRALAREAAERSIVLLENRPAVGERAPMLPLDAATTRRIAVIGRLATLPNTGDHGSSRVTARGRDARSTASALPRPPRRQSWSRRRATISRARVAAARVTDVAVVVCGYTFRDEGEYLFFSRRRRPAPRSDSVQRTSG